MASRKHPLGATQPGYGMPDDGQRRAAPAIVPAPPLSAQGSLSHTRSGRSARVPPSVEVVYEDIEHGGAPTGVGPAIEVWTRNRIYRMDGALRCVEVVDRTTGLADTAHNLLGTRLSGGQKRGPDKIEMYHPLPLPGSEAVFKQASTRAARYGHTSTVERVVLYIRHVTAPLVEGDPVWDRLTSPPSGGRS